MLLSQRLLEVMQTLQRVQHIIGPQSPNVVPALQELVHVLLKTQKTIVNDCFCGEKWLETAIRQGGDLKETFAEILFDLRWLCYILLTVVVVGQDSQVFQLVDCNRTLCETEVNNLFIAAKKDQEELKSLLLKGDHTCCGQSCCIENTSMECLATQLLKKFEFQTEFQAWSTTEKKNYFEGLYSVHANNLRELLHVLSINKQDLEIGTLLGEVRDGRRSRLTWRAVCDKDLQIWT
jgi:L-lactate permease